MKNNILNLALTVGVLLSALFSCDTNTPGAQENKYSVAAERYTFYADADKYKEATTGRADKDQCKFTWKVLKVNRNGNVLTIDISRPSGCDVKYEIIWDGIILESYPGVANVFLKAQSENCTNQADTTTDKLVVDLEAAFKDIKPSTLKDTNFNIREFCATKDIQCEKNCDVTITN